MDLIIMTKRNSIRETGSAIDGDYNIPRIPHKLMKQGHQIACCNKNLPTIQGNNADQVIAETSRLAASHSANTMQLIPFIYARAVLQHSLGAASTLGNFFQSSFQVGGTKAIVNVRRRNALTIH